MVFKKSLCNVEINQVGILMPLNGSGQQISKKIPNKSNNQKIFHD